MVADQYLLGLARSVQGAGERVGACPPIRTSSSDIQCRMQDVAKKESRQKVHPAWCDHRHETGPGW